MIEMWRTSPAASELVRKMQDTRIFLKMAAIELRRIAERTPDATAELRIVAEKLEAEAAALAGREAE